MGYSQSASAPSVNPQLALINVNKATKEELVSIQGIGSVIADRIVTYRETNGSFEQLEDLMDVQGIGEAKFERMKNQLTL